MTIYRQGKYIGYFQSLEGSCIIFSDDLNYLSKGVWSFGHKIFETDGLSMDDIEKMYPEPRPALGTVLDWLEKNKKEIESTGNILHRI